MYLITDQAEGGLGVSEENALFYYAAFTGFMYFGAIPAGIIGDHLLSSRSLCWIGGFITAAGMLLMAIGEFNTSMIGLIMVALGTSTYLPNHLATVGHGLRHDPKIIDAGFLIIALVVNLGALSAAMVIGALLDITSNHFRLIFILLGFLMLAAQVVFLLLEPTFPKEPKGANNNLEAIAPEPEKQRLGWTMTAALIFAMGMFWMSYEIIHFEFASYQAESGLKFLQQFINPFLIFILSPVIITTILTNKVSSVKLIIAGLGVAIIGAALNLEVSLNVKFIKTLAFIVLFSFSEIAISLIFGVLARYNAPRHYGKIFGFMFGFLAITGLISSYSSKLFAWLPDGVPLAVVAMVALAIAMVVLWVNKSRRSSTIQ